MHQPIQRTETWIQMRCTRMTTTGAMGLCEQGGLLISNTIFHLLMQAPSILVPWVGETRMTWSCSGHLQCPWEQISTWLQVGFFTDLTKTHFLSRAMPLDMAESGLYTSAVHTYQLVVLLTWLSTHSVILCHGGCWCSRIIQKVLGLLYSLRSPWCQSLSHARPYCEVDSGPPSGDRQQGCPAATTHVCLRWALHTMKQALFVTWCCLCTGSSGLGAPSSRQQQGTKQVSQSGSE